MSKRTNGTTPTGGGKAGRRIRRRKLPLLGGRAKAPDRGRRGSNGGRR